MITMIMTRVRYNLIVKREHAVLAFVCREATVRSQTQLGCGGNILKLVMIVMVMMMIIMVRMMTMKMMMLAFVPLLGTA